VRNERNNGSRTAEQFVREFNSRFYQLPAKRRYHSTFDLLSVIDEYGSDLCVSLIGTVIGNVINVTIVPQTDEDHDVMKTLRLVSETSRLLQREHRSSTMYQFDRMNVLAHPMASLRGMSICHFDKMEVPAKLRPCR